MGETIHSWGPIAIDALLPHPSQDAIRKIPMLYRASRLFAYETGNEIVGRFLDAVPPPKMGYESLDVKVCMLKPGWWPCIPGWHLDDFHRGDDGQPALKQLSDYPSKHYMALFGDASLTQFLIDTRLAYPPKNLERPVYGWYNEQIEAIENQNIETVSANVLYSFRETDFHRGTQADKSGWRAFFRLTQSAHRKPKDEIRQQVQVYVPQKEFFRGW